MAHGAAYALRARVEGQVAHSYTDLIMGEVRGLVDDFVIARKDGVASYNLATVVDDAASGVTLVVRGADLATTTCRQLWLASTLGLASPQYAHLPLVMSSSGERLSKRDGAVTISDLTRAGATTADLQRWVMRSLGASQDHSVQAFADPSSWFVPSQIPKEPVTWRGLSA
jgi:glutamyl-tRNA synthetase